MAKIRISINHTLVNSSGYLVWADWWDSCQVDVNVSAPALQTLQPSWQISMRDDGTLLHGGSTCKVAATTNSMGCDSVYFSVSKLTSYPTSVWEQLPLIQEDIYIRNFHIVNFRLYFQFRVNTRSKAKIGSKYTFPHLKLEESYPYVLENRFVLPKQINLYFQSELICHKCIHKMSLFVLILLAHLIFSSTPFPGQGRWSD